MTTQIPHTMQCPYPGFETFAITYNMMASQEAVDGMIESIGNSEPSTAEVILEMHGWPEAEYPGGPFSKKAPMLVSIWALRMGFQKAMVEYVSNPI